MIRQKIKLAVFSFFISCSLLVNTGFSQLVKVNYIGALGTSDWTKGWSSYRSAEYPEGTLILEGKINKNTTLYKNRTYLLRGTVYVTSGAILNIEPGTIIRGEFETSGTLVITKGSQIKAIGTTTEPIIFTSNKPAAQRQPGDWGGIILLGKAKLNLKAKQMRMEGNLDSTLAFYGGDNDADNSGIMKFVRIEYPGRKFSFFNELNGLSLCAVGNKTIIENVQVSFSNDDSFEWYGGSVNGKYLISYRCKDDDFDVNFGNSSTLQFCIALRHPLMRDVSKSYAIESESYPTEIPPEKVIEGMVTKTVFCNFDMILASDDKAADIPMSNTALYLGNNTCITLANSVMSGFKRGIFAKGGQVEDNIREYRIRLSNNLIYNCLDPIINNNPAYDINTWFSELKYENISIKNTAEKIFIEDIGLARYAYTLLPKSPYFSFASFDGLINENATQNVVEQAKLSGAIPGEDWTKTWTNFNPNASVYPSTGTVVQGNLSGNIVWSPGTTYVLTGNVTLSRGAVLTIQPGTVILGDFKTKATLLIQEGAKITAKGTVDKPIIFTSNQQAGSRKTGDWGGIVIVGNDRVIEKQLDYVKKQFGLAIAYDKNNPEEVSEISFVRIEYSGMYLNSGAPKEIPGLTLIGVHKLKLSNIQVSYSKDVSFEFIGGTANGKYLISEKCSGEDFVANLGYQGTIQYFIARRDPKICDLAEGHSIRITNAENESNNEIVTEPIFYNLLVLGPIKDKSSQYNNNYKVGVILSRNSGLILNNSILTGFPVGIQIDGKKTCFNAKSGMVKFNGSYVASCVTPFVENCDGEYAKVPEIFSKGGNALITDFGAIKMKDPFNATAPSFILDPTTPCISKKL